MTQSISRIQVLSLYFVNYGTSENELWHALVSSFPENFFDDVLKERWLATFKSEKNSAVKDIKNILRFHFLSCYFPEKRCSDFYFSRNIIDQMKRDFSNLFVLKSSESNPVFAKIYDRINLFHETIFFKSDELIRDNFPYINILKLSAKIHRSYEKWSVPSVDIPGNVNENLFTNLWKLFEFTNGNTQSLENAGTDDELYQIERFIDNSFDAVIEAFSDCMMIKFFNLNIEDYLTFIWLISDGDENDRLPVNLDNVLRIGCVFRCCFDKSKDDDPYYFLPRETKKEIIETDIYIIGKKGKENLAHNIEEILSKGNIYQDMTNFFVHSNSYLRQAVDQNSSLFFERIIGNEENPLYPFTGFYQNWKKSVEQDQGIGKVYPEIFNFWLKCAKGKQNQKAGDLFGNLEQ